MLGGSLGEHEAKEHKAALNQAWQPAGTAAGSSVLLLLPSVHVSELPCGAQCGAARSKTLYLYLDVFSIPVSPLHGAHRHLHCCFGGKVLQS